jgi:transcriptional regulator with XRE-family HTH domain
MMTPAKPPTFAEQLRAHRLRLNLTQAELGSLFGHQGHEQIRRWENSQRAPDRLKQQMILQTLEKLKGKEK